MSFVVKDSNMFKMPGNPHMLHLATITYNPPNSVSREFVVMACIAGPSNGKCYIEEVSLNMVDLTGDVWANLKFIDDDNLAFDLAKFAEEKKLTDMKSRFAELEDRRKLSWVLPKLGL